MCEPGFGTTNLAMIWSPELCGYRHSTPTMPVSPCSDLSGPGWCRRASQRSARDAGHRFLRCCPASCVRFFAGSKFKPGTPSGRSSQVTASVPCMCRPRLDAPVWFVPISGRPSQPGRREKFRSTPPWMARTVFWPRIRQMVCSRCGARMFVTVTSDSTGASIGRCAEMRVPAATAEEPGNRFPNPGNFLDRANLHAILSENL